MRSELRLLINKCYGGRAAFLAEAGCRRVSLNRRSWRDAPPHAWIKSIKRQTPLDISAGTGASQRPRGRPPFRISRPDQTRDACDVQSGLSWSGCHCALGHARTTHRWTLSRRRLLMAISSQRKWNHLLLMLAHVKFTMATSYNVSIILEEREKHDSTTDRHELGTQVFNKDSHVMLLSRGHRINATGRRLSRDYRK